MAVCCVRSAKQLERQEPSAVIYYVVFVAVLNLILGYALAVYLKHRALPLVERVIVVASENHRPSFLSRSKPEPPTVETETPKIPDEWLDVLDETQQANSFVEAAIHVLKLEIGKYRDQLVKINLQVRDCPTNPEGPSIGELLFELKQLNEQWLEQQASAAEHFHSRSHNLGDFASLGGNLEIVLEEQAAQIETTCNNIDVLDFETDLKAGCRRLTLEICKLLDMAHSLRDQMHESMVAVLKHERRLETLEKKLLVDSLTGIYNRTGIEAVLWNWWKDDPTRRRQVSIAILDVDRFGRINEQYNPIVGDKIIYGLGQFLADMITDDHAYDVAARYAGQQFFLFFTDTGPRNAMSAVEQIRQTLEQSTFRLMAEAGADIQITLSISAGVTEISQADSTEKLFGRVNKALQAAKKNGRNKSYIDEGSGPITFTPPEYQVVGRTIKLN